MQLVFRSLIVLIAMITYGHAEKDATGKIVNNASEQVGSSVPTPVKKTDAEQTDSPPTAQADETAAGPVVKPAPKQSDNAAAEKTQKPKFIGKPLPEMAMGSPKAPVVMINYSSLTCSHCAHFHTVVLPKIEEKYIKPGYVRIIFRDYPGDQISINAHRLAWSKGELKYLDFVKLLYSTQEKWLTAPDPLAALKKIALQNGVTAQQIDSCLKDQELLDKIIQSRLDGQKKYNVTATPTIIINAKIYPRALTFEEFEEIVKPLLASTLAKDKDKVAEEKKGKKEETTTVSAETHDKKEEVIKVSAEQEKSKVEKVAEVTQDVEKMKDKEE